MKGLVKIMLVVGGSLVLFMALGGQQKPSCNQENYCDTPQDCEGLQHEKCAIGEWDCVNHSCEYTCEEENECSSDSDCNNGEKCIDGECKSLPKCKVSGCSMQVCADHDVITTCEFLPWYRCFHYTECGNYGKDGACAWKPTEGYAECLAFYGRAISCSSDEECPDNYACEDGKCVRIKKSDCKTTGCNGTICSDHDEVSTCNYEPWFRCYSQANECGHFGPGETCAWLNPPEFNACVNEAKKNSF